MRGRVCSELQTRLQASSNEWAALTYCYTSTLSHSVRAALTLIEGLDSFFGRSLLATEHKHSDVTNSVSASRIQLGHMQQLNARRLVVS